MDLPKESTAGALSLFKRMDGKGRKLNHRSNYSVVFKLNYKLLRSVNTFFCKAIKPIVSNMWEVLARNEMHNIFTANILYLPVKNKGKK